jgi:hypothetical protein
LLHEDERPVRLAYQPPASSTFFLTTNQQPASSTFFSQQTSNQPAVLFSQNKSAPVISHQPNEQAVLGMASVGNILKRLFCHNNNSESGPSNNFRNMQPSVLETNTWQQIQGNKLTKL